MTFLQLQTEMLARGFDYLGQDAAGLTRVKSWLNEAYLEDICDTQPWPFLEVDLFGVSPLAVNDLKDVLYVIDPDRNRRLPSTDLRDLADSDPNLIATGEPVCYFLLDSGGNTFVAAYPTTPPPNVGVRYIKVPTPLSADGDTPILPARFHPLIVDGAVVRAYRDSDNWEAAGVAQQALDLRLLKMQDALFSRNLDNTQYVTRVEAHEGAW